MNDPLVIARRFHARDLRRQRVPERMLYQRKQGHLKTAIGVNGERRSRKIVGHKIIVHVGLKALSHAAAPVRQGVGELFFQQPQIEQPVGTRNQRSDAEMNVAEHEDALNRALDDRGPEHSLQVAENDGRCDQDQRFADLRKNYEDRRGSEIALSKRKDFDVRRDQPQRQRWAEQGDVFIERRVMKEVCAPALKCDEHSRHNQPHQQIEQYDIHHYLQPPGRLT